MSEGCIHVYTGNGKGKTTAALGLALRAVGAGKSVFMAQFVKGLHYAELEALKRFPEIRLKQFGRGCFIEHQPEQEDVDVARKGLAEVAEAISLQTCDVLILDEICIALHFHLFELEEVLALLQARPPGMEIVLTGRYAPPKLLEAADLVTEMREVKHYYNKGITARKGIEF